MVSALVVASETVHGSCTDRLRFCKHAKELGDRLTAGWPERGKITSRPKVLPALKGLRRSTYTTSQMVHELKAYRLLKIFSRACGHG